MSRPTCARQQGLSTLFMVLMLLMAGSLILSALQQQSRDNLRNIQSETTAIRQFSAALSAQAWGLQHPWRPQPHWQCQQFSPESPIPQPPLRACLRLETRPRTPPVFILAAHQISPRPIVLWRWGHWENGQLHPSPHGWSDFCPLSPETLCDLP